MNRRTRIRTGFLTLAIWRKLLVIQYSYLFHATRRLIYSRSSSVPRELTNRQTLIHTGKRFKKRFLSKWSIGFKYGALTWNRRLAIFKAKQKRKKNKKK